MLSGKQSKRLAKGNDASLCVNAKVVFQSQRDLGSDPGSAPSRGVTLRSLHISEFLIYKKKIKIVSNSEL